MDTVLLDIDGVLTDGAVYVDASGNETKRILFDDIDAIFEMKRAGLKIGFITGEENDFTRWVQKRFSPDYFLPGCKDKLAGFKTLMETENLDPARTCYVGDAKRDVELLKFVALSFAPSDVADFIKQSAKQVLKTSRGKGVIREVADTLLPNLRQSAPA